jgi:hypothetical protein
MPARRLLPLLFFVVTACSLNPKGELPSFGESDDVESQTSGPGAPIAQPSASGGASPAATAPVTGSPVFPGGDDDLVTSEPEVTPGEDPGSVPCDPPTDLDAGAGDAGREVVGDAMVPFLGIDGATERSDAGAGSPEAARLEEARPAPCAR